MKLTKKEINDKIKLFEVAGLKTGAFDYAIPQSMFDELQKMGLEDIGAHFVADCSGVFPKLRVISEALMMIFNHQSQANSELWGELFVQSESSLASDGDKVVYDIVRDSESVCNQADAGLVDLQMIVEVITAAYARGRKDMYRTLQPLIRDGAKSAAEDIANVRD